jgi:hypothetical protein
MSQRHAETISELQVEVAALRLIVRSMLAHMLISADRPIPVMLRSFEEAAAKMSPDEVCVPDLDPELHRKAYALANKRAQALLRDVGALIVPRRRRTAA